MAIPLLNDGVACIGGYTPIFGIAAIADENRYPVYIHCTGGADRTGTLAFLINALLGVGEDDLIRIKSIMLTK